MVVVVTELMVMVVVVTELMVIGIGIGGARGPPPPLFVSVKNICLVSLWKQVLHILLLHYFWYL